MQNIPSQEALAGGNPQDLRDAQEPATWKKPNQPARRRILVMDDESSILELTSRMLTSKGYDVETSTNGSAAVKLYRAAKDAGWPFDAVLLDLTVPDGMGGFEAFNAMKEYDPGVKAILSSGYSHEPVVVNYKKYGIAGLAPKPYRVTELMDAVEGVLNR